MVDKSAIDVDLIDTALFELATATTRAEIVTSDLYLIDGFRVRIAESFGVHSRQTRLKFLIGWRLNELTMDFVVSGSDFLHDDLLRAVVDYDAMTTGRVGIFGP